MTLLYYYCLSMMLLGGFLVFLSLGAQTDLGDNCNNHSVHVGLNLILSMGVIMTTLPVVILMCTVFCENCKNESFTVELLIKVTMFLSLFLLVSSVVVLTSIKDKCDYKQAKTNAIIIVSISGFALVMSAVLGAKQYFNFDIKLP